jgi:subtilisin family serine protease
MKALPQSRAEFYTAMEYAAHLSDNFGGADVINGSYGYYYFKDKSVCGTDSLQGIGPKFDGLVKTMEQELHGLQLGNSVFVAIPQNCTVDLSSDQPVFEWPAGRHDNPNIVTVGGVNTGTTMLARFVGLSNYSGSAYGQSVDIFAPATDFVTLMPGSQDQPNGVGVSFAAPLVTGTIALMLNADPSLKGNVPGIISRLQCNSDPVMITGVAGVSTPVSQSSILLNTGSAVLNSNSCP